jgi:hypothetical protein
VEGHLNIEEPPEMADYTSSNDQLQYPLSKYIC